MGNKTPPAPTKYFNNEEQHLIESIEKAISKDDYVPVSNLTTERLEMFRQAARNILNEKTIN